MVCLSGRPARVLDGARRNGFEIIPRVEMQAALRALSPSGWGGVSSSMDEVIEAVFVEGVGARQCAADVPYFDSVHTDKALL